MKLLEITSEKFFVEIDGETIEQTIDQLPRYINGMKVGELKRLCDHLGIDVRFSDGWPHLCQKIADALT
ncbi:hypothetical protein AHIS1_p048 [Acaryochloris phage A-HIS1]|nr:hypothetical protein AHIS1_p048 [Acaryochloris phage A-HIS1]